MISFDETFRFITQHQVALEGGWWSTVNEDGVLSGNRNRTTMWQGAYHNGRALLLSEQILRKSTSRRRNRKQTANNQPTSVLPPRGDKTDPSDESRVVGLR